MTDRINERNKEIMSSIFDKVQPAVKKETRRVAIITAVGLVLMWIFLQDFTLQCRTKCRWIIPYFWEASEED